MPANAMSSSESLVHQKATVLQISFGDKQGYRFSRVRQVVLQHGVQANFVKTELSIPSASAHAKAPVFPSPPQDVRVGTPFTLQGFAAGGNGNTILSGKVRDCSPTFSHNREALITECADTRYALEGLSLMGSFWATTDANGKPIIEYRQGWDAHPNPGKKPNAIFRQVGDGLIPFFCEINQGLSDNDSIDPNAGSTTQACLWTNQMVLKNIWFAMSAAGFAAAGGASGPWPWYPWADPEKFDINWEIGYADAIGVASVGILSGPQQGLFAKFAEDKKLNGQPILQVIERVCNSEGPFSIYFGPAISQSPDGDITYKNNFQIIRTKYANTSAFGNAITMYRPVGDITTWTSNTISEATLSENGQKLFTKFVLSGGRVFIERRIYTNGTEDSAATGLKLGWTAQNLTDFKAYASARAVGGRTNSGKITDQAIQDALAQFPSIATIWRVDQAFDFQTGTSEAFFPAARVSRPILDTLLSCYLEKDTLANINLYKRRLPVVVEYKPAGTSDWLTLENNSDGFFVDGNGSIGFDTLKNVKDFVKITWTGTTLSTFDIADVRITVAIPCDHRVTAFTDRPPNDDDNSRIEDGFYRPYFIENEGDLGKELRKGAFPTPEVAGGTPTTFPDRDGVGATPMRDDTPKLAAHVQDKAADFGRLFKSGALRLPRLSLNWSPGMMIKDISSGGVTYPVRAVVARVEHTITDKESFTTLFLE